jgi:hypothetical protein
MCNYSRRFARSRAAQIGDTLIITSFRGRCGFAAIDDERIGICLQPGTELAFDKPVDAISFFGRWFSRWMSKGRPRTVAQFQQGNSHGSRHDLLEFPDGHCERVARLYRGQTVKVLQVPPLPVINPIPPKTSRARKSKRLGNSYRCSSGTPQSRDMR